MSRPDRNEFSFPILKSELLQVYEGGQEHQNLQYTRALQKMILLHGFAQQDYKFHLVFNFARLNESDWWNQSYLHDAKRNEHLFHVDLDTSDQYV